MSVAQILSPNGLVAKNYLPLATTAVYIYNQEVLAGGGPITIPWSAPRAGFYLVQMIIILAAAGSNPGTSGANNLEFGNDQWGDITMTPASMSLVAGHANTATTTAYMAAGSNSIVFTPAADFATGAGGALVVRVLGPVLSVA